MTTKEMVEIEKAKWHLKGLGTVHITLWHGDIKICWFNAEQVTDAGRLTANPETNQAYALIILEALEEDEA